MFKKLNILFVILFLIILISSPVLADQIELQNGEKLRGNVQNSNLKLRTDYAEINIQTQYLNKISRENGSFVLKASENNSFSGELLTEIVFAVNGSERNISPSSLNYIDFSDNKTFNNNKGLSVTLRNGDFFFASAVENGISINTSLGSSLNLNYNNISSIEYLNNEGLYLIKRKNNSNIKSDLSGQKMIVWPAAGDMFELSFDYVRKIVF